MQERDTIQPLQNYFKLKEGNISFMGNHVKNTLILPYTVNLSDALARSIASDYRNFNGIVGELYRFSQNKRMPTDLEKADDFKLELREQILKNAIAKTNLNSPKDIDLARNLNSIIKSLYFKNKDLIKYGHQAMPWHYWNKNITGLTNLSSFFVSLFIDEKTKLLFCNRDETKIHLFHQLINLSLPGLTDAKGKQSLPKYLVIDENVISKFRKDLNLLSKDSQLFLDQINNLTKYYYYFYVSSLATKLNHFFKEEYEPLYYFTLESETFSKNRKANQKGWRKQESYIQNLFSHSVCLDLLNHIKVFKEPSDYIQIKKRYKELKAEEQSILISDIRYIRTLYITNITLKDKTWDDFEAELKQKPNYLNAETELEKEILHLWYAIDFQFHYAGKKARYKDYSKWFLEFCKVNYLKKRGPSGYTLTLDSENLLFLTRLAVGQNPKIRLKELWNEFQERGVLLDDGSKRAIIEFFEKINLIEKKSDSGDAQYVKAIL